MALARSTSSPRDHVADANPDLARKKQRISDGAGASTEDGIVIEACEPEDIGTNIENAIEIEDGLSDIMEPYSDAFDITHDSSLPIQQLGRLEFQLVQNYCIERDHFHGLADSVGIHIEQTVSHQSDEWRRHYLEEEVEFFSKLALVAIRLLNNSDLSEQEVIVGSPLFQQAFVRLLDGLVELSSRILPLIPDSMKQRLSRRDSAQSSNRQPQILGYLYYVIVAYMALSPEAPTVTYFQNYDKRSRLDAVLKRARREFFGDDIVSSLATIVRTISGAMRGVKDSWLILQHALNLLRIAMVQRRRIEEYPQKEIEDVMDVVTACIIPAVVEKHPRALPDGFHNTVLEFGKAALLSHTHLHDETLAFRLYERFVKSSTDAVLPQTGDEESAESSLWNICGQNQTTLAQLLSASWYMQGTKKFICSDIMDIRTLGLQSLNAHLLNLYNVGRNSHEGFDHPVIQYAVRFVRTNEMTRYIFGPESRAGLLSHSANLICFLAATSAYTDAETDVIWHACSTSVETDFVKASFSILLSLLEYLDFDRLLFIAKKYTSTAVESLGADAADFLPKLLIELEKKSHYNNDRTERLEIIFTTIAILKQANAAEKCQSAAQLRGVAMSEIGRLANPLHRLEDRVEIHKQCIPLIQQRAQDATTAVEVLSILLNGRISFEETQHILSMLPLSAAVDEFCSFVEKERERESLQPYLRGAHVRLDCIVRLMSLTSASFDEDTKQRLFAYVFGDLALCNEARNAAWDKLNAMASNAKATTAVTVLWQGLLHEHVPSLAANFATAKLIDFVCASLKADYGVHLQNSDSAQFLQLPLWSALVRFATTSTDDHVAGLASEAILDILFAYPTLTRLPLAAAAQCQTGFVCRHIQALCADNGDISPPGEAAKYLKFCRSIDLLRLIYCKSKDMAAMYTLDKQKADILVLGDLENDPEQINFTAQVHAPDTQPRLLNIEARKDTLVSELLAKLPSQTGVPENRVIAGGVEISQVPNKSLAAAGVQQSSMIMICPKYTFDMDLDKILTSPGPVEQEILAQYKSLESLLDAHDLVAQRAFGFLKNIRPSGDARVRITSSSATAEDLFPPSKRWRAMFSLYVMNHHLHDLNRLGVADITYIGRSIHLLASYLVDNTRTFDPTVVHDMIQCLVIFLRERPNTEEQEICAGTETEFISCMIVLCFNTTDLDIGVPRSDLAAIIYYALVLAARTSYTMWDAFTRHERILDLHQRLLLDADAIFSSRIAKSIRNVCQEPDVPKDIAHFFWRAIIPGLPKALQSGPQSEVYFSLAMDVLHCDQITQADEEYIRGLLGDLTTSLWSYQHSEYSLLPFPDKAMGGLLRLLRGAMHILKSFKKPLEVSGFSTRIFRQLLFPQQDDSNWHPLISGENRSIAFDLVRLSLESHLDYDEILDTTVQSTRSTIRSPGAMFPGQAEWIRTPGRGTGLKNLGMTCYMNSLLQQLFGNLQFRKFILDQPIEDETRQEVLVLVQHLFAMMQSCTDPVADTAPLAEALNVQVGNQEDVHTFYTTLLSRLEDSIPSREDKAALRHFFTGNSITQVKGECGHVSSRTESFTELSITVKNKTSLRESLDEFVQGEPLEGANKYMCMTCEPNDGGRLVNAMRRTCLDEVPDNLTFCLKRFTYEAMLDGENKVNDRFEFPKEIDMSLYKRQYLEAPEGSRDADKFELVGVIVHQGSLQFGHYWSYVRVPGSQDPDSAGWMYLEDNKFQVCDHGIQDVQGECSGGLRYTNGNERADSAYVLCYQRKGYLAQANALNVVPAHLQAKHVVLPRVNLSKGLDMDMDGKNRWRNQIAFLFSKQFSTFVLWLSDQYPSIPNAKVTALAGEVSGDDNNKRIISSETSDKVGDLIASYTFRLLLFDNLAETKVGPLISSLNTNLDISPSIAGRIIHYLVQDAFGFEALARQKNDKVRVQGFAVVEKCLAILREQSPELYKTVLPRLINSHASLLGGPLDLAFGQWDEYFAFASNLATLGRHETGIILENHYLEWVFDVLYLRLDQERRKRHITLWNWSKTNVLDCSSLFQFVFDILSQHVDLSIDPDPILNGHPGDRVETPDGWTLTSSEMHTLFKRRPVTADGTGKHLWSMFIAATRSSTEFPNWLDYPFGKLVGLFVSEKAHVKISEFVENQLKVNIEDEASHLKPLVFFALHFCLNRDDQGCKMSIKALASSLTMWDGSEKTTMLFISEAFKLKPSIVIDTVPSWAPDFLIQWRLFWRQRVFEWLKTHMFEAPPLSEDPFLDASRIRSTRSLVAQCRVILEEAFAQELGRGKYEIMIQVMEQAKIYLTSLQDEVVRRHQDDDFRFAPQVRVEYDESRLTMNRLNQLLEEMSIWEPETVLPTRPHEVRKSVEIETDDAESSDGELEADEYSDGMSSR